MDNASYHLTKPATVPKASDMHREDMDQFMAEHQIPPPDISPRTRLAKTDLEPVIRDYIKNKIPSEIEDLAFSAGHRILHSPAYHSDLEPIELLWALVKGKVRRQYTEGIKHNFDAG